MGEKKLTDLSDRYIGIQALLVGLGSVAIGYIFDHTNHSDISSASSFVAGTTGGLILIFKGAIKSLQLWLILLATTAINVVLVFIFYPIVRFNIMYASPVFIIELFSLRHIFRNLD